LLDDPPAFFVANRTCCWQTPHDVNIEGARRHAAEVMMDAMVTAGSAKNSSCAILAEDAVWAYAGSVPQGMCIVCLACCWAKIEVYWKIKISVHSSNGSPGPGFWRRASVAPCFRPNKNEYTIQFSMIFKFKLLYYLYQYMYVDKAIDFYSWYNIQNDDYHGTPKIIQIPPWSHLDPTTIFFPKNNSPNVLNRTPSPLSG
jgi:hypothetical protein